MGKAFVVSDHAVSRWLERVNSTTDPRQVPTLVKRAWETNRVTVVDVDSAGREVCQVGDLMVIAYRSNSRTVIVTVLGKAAEHVVVAPSDRTAERREQRWRRNQRQHALGQIHRSNWQLRRGTPAWDRIGNHGLGDDKT